MKRFIVVGLTLAAVLACLLPMQAARAAGKIVIYTSVPSEIMSDIQTAFEAANPDVKLDVFRSGTGKLVAKLATEAEVGKIQADVLWLADPTYYETMKRQNILAKLKSKEVLSISPKLRDRDGFYVAGRLINMVIAYHTASVKADEVPRDWKALLDKKWRNTVAVPNPSDSGTALGAVGALVDKYKWSYFKSLRQNEAVAVRGPSDVAQKVASGEFKVGMTLDYTVRSMMEKGSPIALVYPKDGTIAVPSPVAIIKTTSNMTAAQKFVDFVLSRRGQEAMVSLGSFIPVRPDVQPPAGAPGLDEILRRTLPIDWLEMSSQTEEIIETFADIMMF